MTERQAAVLRLMQAASRAESARTSACDARAALCLAIGHTCEEINPERGNLRGGVR